MPLDHLQKTKKKYKNLNKRYIYQNKLGKGCFQHDMAYGDFKDLTKRTASDKILCDKAFNISKNSKYDRNQHGLASMLQFFYKKASATREIAGSVIKNENISKKELAEELHKPIFRKFKKRKVYSYFIDNIWDANLADTQLICKFYKGLRFLLCVIDIFGEYAWLFPLEDITINNTFQKILDKSNYKPNKKWVEKGSEFYKRSMKSWLQDNDVEMCSIHKEEKSAVGERFIRTLKKIYKYMTSVSKNVYIDKLDEIKTTIHIIEQLN